MDTNLFNLIRQSHEQGSNAPWITIASAIVAAIPAILAYLKGLKVEKDVKEVHLSINSRLDRWLEVEKKQGYAEGKAEERHEAAVTQAAPSLPLTEERIRAIFAEMMKK